MVNLFRSALLPAALVCLLAVSGCSPNGADAASERAASAPSAAGTPVAPTTSASLGESAGTPSSMAQEDSAVALEQSFTSPDGTLSFRYPTGWTVEVPDDISAEVRRWEVHDAAGEQVLSLTLRPDEDMYKASPPLTPLVIPQGKIPGVVDKLGTPTLVAVAASPGQCTGCDAGLLYGMTSATGADPVYGDIQWGEGHLLSFGGSHMLGSNTEVDMAAEAEQFAASTRFRTQILPILQSLTASTTPALGEGETPTANASAPNEDSSDPDPAGMTPGDIGRWAEDLEEEYLAQYGHTEFMDAEDDTGSAPSAIITFDATTYGELRVYTWAWISQTDAETVAEDVAAAMAGLPDAPHTVTVSNGADGPTLATSTVNN